MSLPVIAWITPGVRRQLEAFAQSQDIPAELCAGEAITAYLRAQGAPPADPVPVDIVTAQYRPLPESVIEHIRHVITSHDSTRGMAIHRAAGKHRDKTKGEGS